MGGSEDQHFSLEAAGVPTMQGVFVDLPAIPAVEFVDGLRFQPTLGQNTLANLVSFEPHTEAPMHAHVEEQVVIVVEGQFDFTIDGETRTMQAGDIAVIPPWVPHGAVTREHRCVEVDVFSPPHVPHCWLMPSTRRTAASRRSEGHGRRQSRCRNGARLGHP